MGKNIGNGIVHAFFDADNLYKGLKEYGQGLNFEKLQQIIEKYYKGSIINLNFYIPRTNPEWQNADKRIWLIDFLNKLGYRVVECLNDLEQEVDDYIFQDILINTAKSLPYIIKLTIFRHYAWINF